MYLLSKRRGDRRRIAIGVELNERQYLSIYLGELECHTFRHGASKSILPHNIASYEAVLQIFEI
jgi:hypothetical protein